jgi:hypothetical protein
MSVDHLAHAFTFRARARACRTLAQGTSDSQSASRFAELAESYDRLARSEESLAARARARSEQLSRRWFRECAAVR